MVIIVLQIGDWGFNASGMCDLETATQDSRNGDKRHRDRLKLLQRQRKAQIHATVVKYPERHGLLFNKRNDRF